MADEPAGDILKKKIYYRNLCFLTLFRGTFIKGETLLVFHGVGSGFV